MSPNVTDAKNIDLNDKQNKQSDSFKAFFVKLVDK